MMLPFKSQTLSLFLILVFGSILINLMLSTTFSDAFPIASNLNVKTISHPPFPFAHIERQRNKTFYYPIHPSTAFTINQLLELCTAGNALTITRSWAMEATQEIIETEYLSTCHAFELSIDQGGRSMGHCSDFVNYILHANTRLVKDLAPEIYTLKASLCPNSTYLHGEFPIDPFYQHRRRVRNVWLPNVEQIHPAQEWYFAETYMFLCKTRIGCKALKGFLDAKKLSDIVKLKFMSHSSPDALESALLLLNSSAPMPTRSFSSVFHSHGHSLRKHTTQLIQCYKRHPEWPTLNIVGSTNIYKDSRLRDWMFWKRYHNIIVHEFVTLEQLRRLQYSNGIHVCASEAEGFGHYINEARSLGSFILTTNHPPMNEFIDSDSGTLISPQGPPFPEKGQVLGPYASFQVHVTADQICDALTDAFATDILERQKMGREARLMYEHDTAVMQERMVEIYRDAVEHLTRFHLGWNQSLWNFTNHVRYL
ncbi:hypothetical protein HDU98_007111 [Podochytrium sp. JEL0797]|nr:hypothetical protein HDU98_007111 [Podochytrium sp. JEL0797]